MRDRFLTLVTLQAGCPCRSGQKGEEKQAISAASSDER
jgi:hypothetical protein